MIGEVNSSTAGNSFVDSLIEPVNLGPEPLTVVAEAGGNDLLGINSSGEDFESRTSGCIAIEPHRYFGATRD